MKQQEFCQEVRKKAPTTVGQKALDAAIDYHVDNGDTQKWDVPKCIQLAWRIERYYSSEREDRDAGVVLSIFPVTPSLLIESDTLADEIKPWVEDTRMKMFNNVTAPFESYDKATRWLLKEAKTIPKPSPDAQKRIKELVLGEDALASIHELQELSRLPVRGMSPKGLLIPYCTPGDEWVQHVAVSIDPPLGILADESKKIANATGFSHVSVVAYILADIKPLLPPARVNAFFNTREMPDGRSINRQYVQVEFESGNITRKDLTDIYDQVRKGLRTSGRKRFSAKNQKVLEVVAQCGGTPGVGETGIQFWTRVNATLPEDFRYKNWEGVRKAYTRLDARISKREQA
jgi:hypothetical protein